MSVTVTHFSSDLSAVVVKMLDLYETKGAAFRRPIFCVSELTGAVLHNSVSLDWIDRQCFGREVPLNAPDIGEDVRGPHPLSFG